MQKMTLNETIFKLVQHHYPQYTYEELKQLSTIEMVKMLQDVHDLRNKLQENDRIYKQQHPDWDKPFRH